MNEKFKESIESSIQNDLANLKKEINKTNEPWIGDDPTVDALINVGKLTAQRINEATRNVNKTSKGKENVDPTPEMSINEIMKLSKNDIIFDVDKHYSDKYWKFTVIKGKKVYISLWNKNRTNKLINDGKPVINVEWSPITEWYAYFTIWKKVWNVIKWVSCWADVGLQSHYRWTYRWELEPWLEISKKNWNDESKRERED